MKTPRRKFPLFKQTTSLNQPRKFDEVKQSLVRLTKLFLNHLKYFFDLTKRYPNKPKYLVG